MPPKKANNKKNKNEQIKKHIAPVPTTTKADSDEDIPVKKISNAFSNLMSDSEPDKEDLQINKKSSNPFGDLSEEENDNDDEEKDEEEEILVNKKNNIVENKKNIVVVVENKKNIVVDSNIKKDKQNNKKDDSIKINKKENKKDNKKNNVKNNNHNTIDEGKSNLFVEDVELIIDGKILIHESKVVINTNTRICCVGNNGSGKSSLLKYIYEKIKNTTDIDVLMIDQHVEIEENDKIYDFVLKANKEMYDKHKQFVDMEEKEELTDEEMILYEELSEYLNVNEWDKFNAETKKVLSGMGFEDINISTEILSGGLKMRCLICRALIRKPTLLIMDETNNFLDLESNLNLTNYLSVYPKSLVLITHQMDLINSVSDIIWYIGNMDMTGNKIHVIRGHYDNLIKKRNQTIENLEKKYDEYQKKIKSLRNKSTPKSQVDNYIKEHFTPRPPKEYKIKIEFENVMSPGGNRIIELNDVKFGYEDKQIFEKLNFTISMDSRNIICSPNGSGKTTLFKLISGKVTPQDGYIIKDDRLRVGYYHQLITDNLPLNLTPIEYLKSLDGKLDDGKCRAILGKISIKKTEEGYDLPKTLISNLSGGQKLRVSIASIQMFNPHLLLLDEISAHMDIETIEALISSINSFNSAVVLISHDVHLIKNINNATLYEVNREKKDLIKFNGNFNDYIDKIINKD